MNPATLVFIPRDSRGFRENPLIRIPVQVSSLDCHCSGCVHAEQSRACAMTRVDSVDNMPRKDAVPALRSTSTPTTANTRVVFAVYTHQSTFCRSVCPMACSHRRHGTICQCPRILAHCHCSCVAIGLRICLVIYICSQSTVILFVCVL